MNIVFIVTSGEHADYGINEVFSTFELATQYAQKLRKNSYNVNVEQWTVNDKPTAPYQYKG